MSWTQVADVREAFDKRWRRGDILRAALDPNASVPLHVILKGPGSRELSGRFVEVRAWMEEWRSFEFGRVEWIEKRDRVVGSQHVPAVVRFETTDALVHWLGHHGEVQALRALADAARSRRPTVLDWLLRHPFQALDLADAWPLLLDAADWFDGNPHSGLYARQVDIPGVHSKFIEKYSPVLRDWLSAGVSLDVDPNLGLRVKSGRLRFRILDPELATLPGTSCPDITLDAVNFARLELPVGEVFITENEVNYLAFPERKGAMVLFGAGYGWSALAQAEWLHGRPMRYWGDIDTHGFAILDGLRASFPHVDSFLMDRQTLMDHVASWGTEDDPSSRDLARLRPAEAELYDDLRFCRLTRPASKQDGQQVRFEQERVAHGYLTRALASLPS
nr:Wadjet anti-phage system protein JetD domain-containing protein [Luteibacter rhizovicinus]